MQGRRQKGCVGQALLGGHYFHSGTLSVIVRLEGGVGCAGPNMCTMYTFGGVGVATWGRNAFEVPPMQVFDTYANCLCLNCYFSGILSAGKKHKRTLGSKQTNKKADLLVKKNLCF